jgi:transposase-like protein
MAECKNCKSENTVKNGIKRKKQRYLCKDCRYNFVIGHAHHSPQKRAKKALVVMLYSLGKGSYTNLAKIFGVSNGTIYNWVTEAANALPEVTVADEITEIEFDEMWHYIGKKNESCGSSKQLTATQIEWLRGYLANVTKRHSNGSMTK